MRRRLTLLLVLAISLLPNLISAANNDLVILRSERWIDTLKGTMKNISAKRAEEVVILVRFFGQTPSQSGSKKSRSASSRELGRQTVKLAAIEPGEEATFEVELADTHRTATSWKFEPHAIWRPEVRPHAGKR
jgi:hypothetical protein